MKDLNYYLKISNHLAGNLDIRSALESVKLDILQIIPLDHLDICLIEENNTWNTSYEVGLKTSWDSSRGLISISPVRDILTGKNESMITENALEDPRYTFAGAACEPLFQHKLRSRVNVPMKLLGKTIGSLNCSSQQIGLYDKKSIKKMCNIADIIAPYFYALSASENARREAVMRTEIQAREEGLRLGALSLTRDLEQERQKIEMDLHDQTLADLTRIARDLNKEMTAQNVECLQLQVQDCIQGLREIIDSSIPSLLDLFGFEYSINIHLQRALSSMPTIDYVVLDHTNGSIDKLDESIQVALFRITQEALNNAVRHSDATKIKVEIKNNNNNSIIAIHDNGKGEIFEVKDKNKNGLMHMRTRAQLIGAKLNITSNIGTSVLVQLPTEKQANNGLI